MGRDNEAHEFFLALQDKITDALASADGAAFSTDRWDRPEGGGGRSCVLSEGRRIEKAGVNVSAVHGTLDPAFADQLPGRGGRFFATGLSLIVHPRSPHAPTVHCNFRYLERGEGTEVQAWFGGGADLTPYILYEEDARHFHRTFKSACDRHSIIEFPRLKKWCDEYFYLPHRQEHRGIGGIFFDYLGLENDPRGTPADLGQAFSFVRDAGATFLDAYLPIFERRKDAACSEDERNWQLHRRGRYVEFNLVYDRGTVFGLKTGGRVESILVSLPNLVRWSYAFEARKGTYQEVLIEAVTRPHDWL